MDHALPQPEALAMRTDERGKRDTDIRERLEKNDQKISNFLKRQCHEKNTTLEQKSCFNFKQRQDTEKVLHVVGKNWYYFSKCWILGVKFQICFLLVWVLLRHGWLELIFQLWV